MLRKVTPVIFSVFVIFSMAGCDQMNKLYEYFTTKKNAMLKESPMPPAMQQPDAAQVPQATPTTSLKEADPAKVLARVGDWTLTIDEFKERLNALKEVMPDFDITNKEQNKLVLEELVRQELLVQEAERRGLGGDKDIAMAIEEFRRTLLVRQLAMQLTQGITATEEEAKSYYAENKNEFISPGEWHVREIAAETKDEAKEILIELLKGADFAEMARQESKSASASKGGDLGNLSEFPFPQMETAAMTLDIGGISSVIEGPDGFYVIKLEDKKGGAVQELEDIKEDIKAGLTLLKQQQEILKQLDDLQQKTRIEVNETLLQE